MATFPTVSLVQQIPALRFVELIFVFLTRSSLPIGTIGALRVLTRAILFAFMDHLVRSVRTDLFHLRPIMIPCII
jgi:hypothetical protein